MEIKVDFDRLVSEIRSHICEHHKQHPDVPLINCTCDTSYLSRTATDSEYRVNRRNTLEARKRELERELWKVNVELELL